jgi:hypothetical protein
VSDFSEADRAAAHRRFSAECFNRTWELIDKADRTAVDDEQMLLCALASLWHWTQRADCSDQNLSIGYWQASRVYSLLGQADNARRFADTCLKRSSALPPFFLAYAHEALAHAAMIAGDKLLLDAHASAARKLAAEIEDPAEREMLERDLEQLRLP